MRPMLATAFAAAALAATLGTFGLPAAAEPIELQWWHAMTAINLERVNKLAADFNASQKDYKITPVYKGSYAETMTAAIAAFRAGSAPHIVQIFEVGTATMMGAKGAVKPVYQLMADAGEPFDPKPICRRSPAITAPPTVRCCPCPSTARPRSSTGTRTPSRKPGSTPTSRPRRGPRPSPRPRNCALPAAIAA